MRPKFIRSSKSFGEHSGASSGVCDLPIPQSLDHSSLDAPFSGSKSQALYMQSTSRRLSSIFFSPFLASVTLHLGARAAEYGVYHSGLRPAANIPDNRLAPYPAERQGQGVPSNLLVLAVFTQRLP
jgi:hypothetical protein